MTTNRLTEAQKASIVKLYTEKEKTAAEVADAKGVSIGTVYRVLKGAGTKMRPRGRRPGYVYA